MTEQEQQYWDEINRMNDIVRSNCQKIFCDQDQVISCDKCECMALYRAGYRRKDEVAKKAKQELAQKYLEWLEANTVRNPKQAFLTFLNEMGIDYEMQT